MAVLYSQAEGVGVGWFSWSVLALISCAKTQTKQQTDTNTRSTLKQNRPTSPPAAAPAATATPGCHFRDRTRCLFLFVPPPPLPSLLVLLMLPQQQLLSLLGVVVVVADDRTTLYLTAYVRLVRGSSGIGMGMGLGLGSWWSGSVGGKMAKESN